MDSLPVAPIRHEVALRLIDASAALVFEGGVSALTMLEVARRAGVSKGLIHYHFRDRAGLLAAILETLTGQVVERLRSTIDTMRISDPLETLWQAVEHEIRIGQLRVILLLGAEAPPEVQRAARLSNVMRSSTAAEVMNALMAALQVRFGIPVELLGALLLTFLDGLAVDLGATDSAALRARFDVFCLALLRLTE